MSYIAKKLLTFAMVTAFSFIFFGVSAHAATITVNSTADTTADDGDCTLREAISSINGSAVSGSNPGECVAGDGSDDVIILPAGTIQLTSDLPALTAAMTIDGAGMGQTIIDGNDGTSYIVFSASATLALNDLTIRDFEGSAVNAINADLLVQRVEIDGANALNDVGFLVGIASLGADLELRVEDSYIHDIASDDAPAVGGIFMGVANSEPAEVSIRRTTIANIEGPATSGGMIFSTGAFDGNNSPANINAIIENNTVNNINSLDNTGNSAAAALMVSSFLEDGENNFDFVLSNNTFTEVDHAADSGATLLGTFFTTTAEGVINFDISLTNNIFASGSSFLDCSIGGTGDGEENLAANSGGGNVGSNASCTTVFDDPADQNNVSSITSTLGVLADNGGYVPTRALLTGSQALDAGVNVAGLTTDARGIARPQGAAYDSGAYELQLDDNTQTDTQDQTGELAETGQSTFGVILLITLLFAPGMVLARRYLTTL